jgi:hypothetical protein
MNHDTLAWWEKLPIVGLFAAQGLYVWRWYVGPEITPLALVVMLAGIAAVAAIDGAMVATVAGMRQGRRSKASYAAIVVTASFGAAVALDLYGAIMLVSAWLHAGFALTIVCYLLHLAAPRASVAHDGAALAQERDAFAQLHASYARAEAALAQAQEERAQMEEALAQWREERANLDALLAQAHAERAQTEQSLATRNDGLARAQATIAQLEQALAQAGDLDLREVAQWGASLGASKRDLARVLRRPESTVRAWVKLASAAD